MQEYKIITLDLPIPLCKSSIAALQDFNRGVKPEELFVKLLPNQLEVHLRLVDMQNLRKICESLTNHYHLNRDDNPLKAIYERIESIKSYGVKGKKRNYVDYNRERRVQDRKNKETARGQYFYAQDNDFSQTNLELPKEFEDQIICGDSLEVLERVPDNCIDLIFTSPPYNFGLDYEGQRDDHYWEGYFDKLFEIFNQCIRVLKYGGRIVVNVQPLYSDYIPSHHFISNFFVQKKMIWRAEIIWEKHNYNCKYTAWGSWKSPSNPYMKYSWEFLEVFSKGSLKKAGRTQDSDLSGDEFKKWVYGYWSIAPERRMKDFDHPAMFPQELAKRVIKMFSFPGDVVLDPFNGVGTTTYTAFRLGRKYLGIDISSEYCDRAKKRNLPT